MLRRLGNDGGISTITGPNKSGSSSRLYLSSSIWDVFEPSQTSALAGRLETDHHLDLGPGMASPYSVRADY